MKIYLRQEMTIESYVQWGWVHHPESKMKGIGSERPDRSFFSSIVVSMCQSLFEMRISYRKRRQKMYAQPIPFLCWRKASATSKQSPAELMWWPRAELLS